MDRRQLLGWAGLLAAAGGTVGVAGCATDGRLLRADVERAPVDLSAVPTVAASANAFGIDLLRAVGTDVNLICSPLSILVALTMVRNGAAGTTAAEMDAVLHLSDLATVNQGLNAVDQTLGTRSGTTTTGARKGKVQVDLANAVWGQRAMTWQPPFLDVLSTAFGTGVRETDFESDPGVAITTINRWVADQTHDKITDIASPEVIDHDTRLALVNALYVKAPWAEPFVGAGDRPFTGRDGAGSVPMVTADVPLSFVRADGWSATRVPLLGGELAMTFVRPDGNLRALVEQLHRGGLDRLLRARPVDGTILTLPTFEYRSTLALAPVLAALGMPTAFSLEADFSGLTTETELLLQAVAHQGFVALDEEGIEASAATVVSAGVASGAAGSEHTLVLDQPFLFCIHDVELAVPLLVGVVVDPAAAT